MQVSVKNMEGEVVGTLSLNEAVFGVPPNETVMHQAVIRQLANARQGTADTKTRGEVSGGAVKPYRQKGTGRARQGSIRSPLYKGGGVVFGPHPRSYEQSLPRKMKRLALRAALSAKVAEDNVLVLDRLSLEAPSTKDMIALLQALGVNRPTLVVLPAVDNTVYLSARNIPNVKTLPVENLNIVDLLNYATLLLPVAAIQRIEGNFGVESSDVEPIAKAAPRRRAAKKEKEDVTPIAEKTAEEE